VGLGGKKPNGGNTGNVEQFLKMPHPNHKLGEINRVGKSEALTTALVGKDRRPPFQSHHKGLKGVEEENSLTGGVWKRPYGLP